MFHRHYILNLLYCKASDPESCVSEGQKLNLDLERTKYQYEIQISGRHI